MVVVWVTYGGDVGTGVCALPSSSRLQPEGLKRKAPSSPLPTPGGQQEREEEVDLSIAATNRQPSSFGDSPQSHGVVLWGVLNLQDHMFPLPSPAPFPAAVALEEEVALTPDERETVSSVSSREIATGPSFLPPPPPPPTVPAGECPAV